MTNKEILEILRKTNPQDNIFDLDETKTYTVLELIHEWIDYIKEHAVQGPAGADGEQGPQGLPGKDTYAEVVKLGYTGTENDFYTLLSTINSFVNKNYVDAQDLDTLNKAKEYTNQHVPEIDLSSYAKTTDVDKKDVEVLRQANEYTDQHKPDLSEYTKTVDIPTIKVNEAAFADSATSASTASRATNADNLNNVPASDYALKSDVPDFVPTKVSELENDENFVKGWLGSKTVELTLAEYLDLQSKHIIDSNTLYNIIDDYEENTGGTTDYIDLTNKPQINGHELVGNVLSTDLGIKDGKDGAPGKDGPTLDEVLNALPDGDIVKYGTGVRY